MLSDPFISDRRIESMTGPIRDRLTHASPEIRLRVLSEVERLRNACGCGTGAVGATLGCLVLIGWQIVGVTAWSISGIAISLVKIFAATLAGGLIGKLAGLAYARARFKRITHRLLENSHV